MSKAEELGIAAIILASKNRSNISIRYNPSPHDIAMKVLYRYFKHSAACAKYYRQNSKISWEGHSHAIFR